MTEFQMKLISRLPPLPKETFKDMLKVNEDLQIFYGDPHEPGILGRAYFASFDGSTYIISYVDWDYNEEEQEPEIVEVFSNYDDFWDYLFEIMEDDDYFPEYNFLTAAPRLTESLTESKRDPFHEAIFEVIDYLIEFNDIFPVPKNIGATNWEELKDDINYGLSSDFEIAEILMEYLKKDLAITERHPEMFEDDPQSELTLEMYIRLKRAFDRAVAAYEAANPEDFQESSAVESNKTSLSESLTALASMSAFELAAAAVEWTVGGYLGFTIGGWLWDRTKGIFNAFKNRVRQVMHQNMTSQWIAYKSYLIEITEAYEINIWNPNGDKLYTGLSSLPAAKRKIDQLPIPEIVSELSVALESALVTEPTAEIPVRESFTPEEMAEYNMDEDGNSLDSYDTYVRCTWCDEIFTEDQCSFEANLGWLCDRCYSAILSRGERLSIIANPTEEDKARVTTEAFEDLKLEEAAERENEVNSSEIDGLDFEEACKKYGVKVEN